jgi:hypothetical protein
LKGLEAWTFGGQQSETIGKDLRLTRSADGYKLAFWRIENCSPTVYLAAVSPAYIGIDPKTQPLAGGIAQEINFGPGVDLVKARELYPQLSDLWDRVRREYWNAVVPPLGRGPVTRSEGRW